MRYQFHPNEPKWIVKYENHIAVVSIVVFFVIGLWMILRDAGVSAQ